MQKFTRTLKKGVDLFSFIDDVEAAVVKYMGDKRELDEAGMRKLLQDNTEVRASYQRKIARSVANSGLNTSILIGK